MNRIHRLFFKLTDQFISFGFEQFAVFCVLWGGGSIFTLFQMRRWMCLCFMRWFNDENEINDECNQLSFVYLMLSSQWHSINNTKNNCHKIEHIPYIKVCVCKMTIRIDSHSWSIFFSFCFFLRWELLLNLLLLLFGFYNSILITMQSSKAHWPGPLRNSKWTRGIMMSFGWNSVRLRSIPFALQINYTKFPSENDELENVVLRKASNHIARQCHNSRDAAAVPCATWKCWCFASAIFLWATHDVDALWWCEGIWFEMWFNRWW